MTGVASPNSVTGIFLEYGNTEQVQLHDIRQLPKASQAGGPKAVMGGQQTSKPHTGQQQASRPHTGQQQTSRSHTAQQASRPHTAQRQQQGNRRDTEQQQPARPNMQQPQRQRVTRVEFTVSGWLLMLYYICIFYHACLASNPVKSRANHN